jgi:hypothetical protein
MCLGSLGERSCKRCLNCRPQPGFDSPRRTPRSRARLARASESRGPDGARAGAIATLAECCRNTYNVAARTCSYAVSGVCARLAAACRGVVHRPEPQPHLRYGCGGCGGDSAAHARARGAQPVVELHWCGWHECARGSPSGARALAATA